MQSLHTRFDGAVFCRDVELSFFDCKANERAKLASVLHYLVDTAGRDYEARGLPRSVLFAHDCAFLVSRLSLRIHRTPVPYDVLTVRTWERGSAGAFVLRDYELLDTSGTLCVSASSAWLIVDPKTRRLHRPSAFTLRQIGTTDYVPDCPPCDKLRAPGELAPLGSCEVRFSDLDGNGHVYSGQYGAIAVDCLPAEYRLRDVRDFSINYIKETLPGETLSLTGTVEGDHAFVSGSCAGEPRFCCAFTFA